MSHPNPIHDRENERVEDSKFSPKAKHNALRRKLNPAQRSVKKNMEALKERKGEAPLERLKRLMK